MDSLPGEQVFTNCTNKGPCFVHVRDGKIVRVRPLVLDGSDAPSWTLEAGGKKFSPPRKAAIFPGVLAERQRIYSDNRIKYPLKRVDFDVNGERHPENRGKSGYERISWEQALHLVSSEMKRLRENFGPAAITAHASSHHNWGNIGYHQSAMWRFFRLIGFTEIFENTDSWEGWHWGAIDAYGFYWRLGMPEQSDLLEDALKNTELIVLWSSDPDTTQGHYSAQESAIWRLWLRELGKKLIIIDPFCNYTSVILGDKWIAPRPGTDAALAEAIAYLWFKEGTYDKEYVNSHTIGFEQWQQHILGQEDGTPRTPQWAEKICDVPVRVITALAKEWASKRTMLGCGTRGGMGGACRQAYATEWARLMIFLQAMQGLGKPGVNIWSATTGGPFNYNFRFPGYAEEGIQHLAKKRAVNPVKQRMQRLFIAECINNPPVHWYGEGFCVKSLEQRFIPYVYPMPGHPECKMFYRYGGAFIGTYPEGNKLIKAYQNSKLEFVVNQDCWWSGETRYADVILPACTNFERNDISEWGQGGGYNPDGSSSQNHRVIVYQKKCIEPIYESKSDYWIFTQLAKRLGYEEAYTEGNTEEDWVKKEFEYSDMPKYMSFEKFKEKGYFVVPLSPDYKRTPAFRWFYEGRECDTVDRVIMSKGLATYSGKIEFVSLSIQKHFPGDTETPAMPRYKPSWEGYDSEKAKQYPLQFISPHVRYSYHTHYDANTPWIGDIPGHRTCINGYYYWTVNIHPRDAEVRGIKNGDIVKMYNDRGAVLGAAHLTERLKPGVVHAYEASSKYDPLEYGKTGTIDRGGCVNLLNPARPVSARASGMAPNSSLIEIEKWEA